MAKDYVEQACAPNEPHVQRLSNRNKVFFCFKTKYYKNIELTKGMAAGL